MVYAWRVTHREKNQQKQGTDGFKFAITLLAALGTGLYTVYNYFQNTAVDSNFYAYVSGFIPVALILLFLLGYIFIKGYSMEVHEIAHKEYLKKLASGIYSITFLMFLTLLTYILSVFILIFWKIEPTFIIYAVIMLISIGVSFILDWPRIKSQPKEKILMIIATAFIVLIYGLFLWLAFFLPVLSSPFQGHVTAEMDSI